MPNNLTDEELSMALTLGQGPLSLPLPEAATLDLAELAHAVWAWLILTEGPYCVHLFGYSAGFGVLEGYSAGFGVLEGYSAGFGVLEGYSAGFGVLEGEEC